MVYYKNMSKIIKIQDTSINIRLSEKDDDFICLTDIAKRKNSEFPAEVVRNWLKTRFTLDFIGMWEQIHNPNFKLVEFDQLRNDAGTNSFILSPQKWIETTSAIGMMSKAGRYGSGTFAHKDIAFEFATWLSPSQMKSLANNGSVKKLK